MDAYCATVRQNVVILLRQFTYCREESIGKSILKAIDSNIRNITNRCKTTVHFKLNEYKFSTLISARTRNKLVYSQNDKYFCSIQVNCQPPNNCLLK